METTEALWRVGMAAQAATSHERVMTFEMAFFFFSNVIVWIKIKAGNKKYLKLEKEKKKGRGKVEGSQ